MIGVHHPADSKWYLLQTKQYKEDIVRGQLSGFVNSTFMPLLRVRKTYRGKAIQQTVPLFPCYLFANFNLQLYCYVVQHTVGVSRLVSAGNEPSEVDGSIIDEIKERERDGVIEIPRQTFRRGQSVQIVNGPWSGFNAIFERYMSGPERIALLLDAIGAANVKLILASDQIAPKGADY